MTRLVTAPRFRSDTNTILNYLEEVAGSRVAARYGGRFEETIVRLTSFPESGAPRPALGVNTRIAIVQPYLLIYDFTPDDNTLTLLRLLHGRRNITRGLLGR
ncbi:MAG: type II toxin-antitoxin system RelE/ParE family toxin [Xanthobacteraceae bacterium]